SDFWQFCGAIRWIGCERSRSSNVSHKTDDELFDRHAICGAVTLEGLQQLFSDDSVPDPGQEAQHHQPGRALIPPQCWIPSVLLRAIDPRRRDDPAIQHGDFQSYLSQTV